MRVRSCPIHMAPAMVAELAIPAIRALSTLGAAPVPPVIPAQPLQVKLREFLGYPEDDRRGCTQA